MSRVARDLNTVPEISIVVPVYRSEDCLDALYAAISEALVGMRFELVLVNDFSPDGSWSRIESLCARYSNVIGVNLRKNFGQDCAILTGMRYVSGANVAIMDDDLQHDPQDLVLLLTQLRSEGTDIVYANYALKKKQNLWKNMGSWLNGKIAEILISKPKEIYLSPYKLMRREIAELICNYSGPGPYVDGLIFQHTSRISQIPVLHRARISGQSNFTFFKSLAVGARLAFSFSVIPLRIATCFGLVFAICGLLLVIIIAMMRLMQPAEYTAAVGWASLAVLTLIVSGVQLVFLGVLGEYSGRTFLRLNGNPQSSVATVLNAQDMRVLCG